uniref:Uncharacterized protein n=1 Tax=Lotus japonicus TaxID=34305 RepID=I3SJS8_LOTJA|nr:unknown [Lotus japonicus]
MKQIHIKLFKIQCILKTTTGLKHVPISSIIKPKTTSNIINALIQTCKPAPTVTPRPITPIFTLATIIHKYKPETRSTHFGAFYPSRPIPMTCHDNSHMLSLPTICDSHPSI